MKIRRIFSVFLLSVLLATLFLTPQAYALEEPTLDARNALLMDETNGRMLYGKAEKEKAYPASITKIMTALLVLEAVDRGDLSASQPITASYEAANSIDEDSSTAGIEEGEVLTVEQLLYCLLIVSANEAANILAEAVSGSVTDFVALMNQRAAELGCEGTHFTNTNGLPDPDHYTTAWDIYLIAREAMKHDLFMMLGIAILTTRLNKSAETDAELKKMWETCMAYDPKWANYFRKRTPLLFVSVPGRVGQEFAGSFYRFANNVVRFN